MRLYLLKKADLLFGINHSRGYFGTSVKNEYATASAYEDVLQQTENAKSLNNQILHLPEGLSLFSSNRKTIRKKYGRPVFHLHSLPFQSKMEILFFKQTIERIRIHIECHLYENRLCMIKYKFPYADEKQSTAIRNKILSDYGYSDVSGDVSVKDDLQQILYIKGKFGLEINYINLNNKVFSNLLSIESDTRIEDTQLHKAIQWLHLQKS